MINTISRVLTIGSMVTLTACGSGSSTTTTTDVTAGSALKIYSESSQTTDITVDIAGTWKTACYTTNGGAGPDQIETITISSTGVFTLATTAYASTNTSCTGSSSDTVTFPTTVGIDASLTVDVEPQIMLGWKDGTGATVAAPARADATGSLSGNPKISQLDLTEASNVYNTAFYIDDSAAIHVMYREDSGSQASNGYTQYIGTADPLFKQ